VTGTNARALLLVGLMSRRPRRIVEMIWPADMPALADVHKSVAFFACEPRQRSNTATRHSIVSGFRQQELGLLQDCAKVTCRINQFDMIVLGGQLARHLNGSRQFPSLWRKFQLAPLLVNPFEAGIIALSAIY
jgi:hypothetical protein